MTGKDLKNSILQFAIQGKLVPQDPNDEPASVLLAKIRKEKEKLVREKKLKKKDLETKPISDDEKPFEIPESWEWCRWGEISFNIQYGYNAPALHSGIIRMVRISDIQNGEVQWENVPFCDIEESEIASYLLGENDILFARTGGTVGKSFLVDKIKYPSIYAGYLIRTQYNNKLLIPKYLKMFMESDFYWIQLKDGTIATAQPNCNGKTLSKMILPLPPLSEQKRIVAKIDELMPLVEEYDKAQAKLDKLNSTFPEALKMSILQEAIQGKLVPQDPNDEPASVLLAKIRKEKEKLVREKKLKKKDQETTPVTDEEKPFEIPESWEWCRLGEMCFLMDGIKKTGKNVLLDARYLRGKKEKEIIESGRFVNMGKTIILVDGENSGEVFVVPHEGYMGSTFKELLLLSSVFNKYLLFIFLFYQPLFRNSKKGEAIPHLNKELFKNLPIGIPPLAEQKRIVAKIEEVLAEIEKLKSELS